MQADYFITPHLLNRGSHPDNAYLKFLKDFHTSPILTFNYDSLVEIILLDEGAWCPDDGYGIPVKTNPKKFRSGKKITQTSIRPVLHLHGSLCVYSSIFELVQTPGTVYPILSERHSPEYIFDPAAIANRFPDFNRIPPGPDYSPVANRVIAPIPNKAKNYDNKFIKAVYNKATELLHKASLVVAIGYSFNKHDNTSFSTLINAAACHRILIVSPDADSTANQLRKDYPNINWDCRNILFTEWVRKGYPGLSASNSSIHSSLTLI